MKSLKVYHIKTIGISTPFLREDIKIDEKITR